MKGCTNAILYHIVSVKNSGDKPKGYVPFIGELFGAETDFRVSFLVCSQMGINFWVPFEKKEFLGYQFDQSSYIWLRCCLDFCQNFWGIYFEWPLNFGAWFFAKIHKFHWV